jgi:Homeodomain-like domain
MSAEAAERGHVIRGLLAEGLSRRAIGTRLGVSEKTVRTALRTADLPAESAPESAAAAPAAARVLEPFDPVRGFHPVPADGRYIRCVCNHPAWLVGVAEEGEYECGCPVGPHGCHGPRQVADETGTPQLVYGPFRLRTHVGLPPGAA